jgi:hypothetical protein
VLLGGCDGRAAVCWRPADWLAWPRPGGHSRDLPVFRSASGQLQLCAVMSDLQRLAVG